MISLIVATLDRTAELNKLLASLVAQSYQDFEVIVVDQNPDGRLLPILQRYPQLAIQHLRSARGLSRARNVGLPHAKGELVGFPDDDCWYPPRLLASLKTTFDSHPDCAVVFTALRDANHETVGPRWPMHAGYWAKDHVWVNGISPAGFVRREVVDAIGLFDERIGVGAATPYQSGEDVDYFVRPLKRGWKIWYDPALTVHHPSFHRLDRIRERSYSYALGGGYTLRAHAYPIRVLATGLVRSFGGALVYLCKGNLLIARCYLLRAAGLARGYICGPSDLKKVHSAVR